MNGQISRRRLAKYIVDQIDSKKAITKVMQEVAGFLISTRREREVDLLVRSISDELESRGTILTRVTSARELSSELRMAIRDLIGVKDVRIESIVDPSVIAGIKVETPSRVMDQTVTHRLQILSRAKI